jgi:hypothetical protein
MELRAKRLIIIAPTLVLLFVAACGEDPTKRTPDSANTNATTATKSRPTAEATSSTETAPAGSGSFTSSAPNASENQDTESSTKAGSSTATEPGAGDTRETEPSTNAGSSGPPGPDANDTQDGEPSTTNRVVLGANFSGARSFFNVPIGETVTQNLYLLRGSSGDVEISTVSIEGKEFALKKNGCRGSVISAGTRCPISIAFTPSGPGPRSAVLRITISGSALPDIHELRGSGKRPDAQPSRHAAPTQKAKRGDQEPPPRQKDGSGDQNVTPTQQAKPEDQEPSSTPSVDPEGTRSPP